MVIDDTFQGCFDHLAGAEEMPAAITGDNNITAVTEVAGEGIFRILVRVNGTIREKFPAPFTIRIQRHTSI